MANLIIRIQAAIAAFRAARHPHAYAVIYDSAEGIDTDSDERREEFYEVFGTPKAAAEIFRMAFPKGNLANDGDEIAHNPRLVMILGDIDNYLPADEEEDEAEDEPDEEATDIPDENYFEREG